MNADEPLAFFVTWTVYGTHLQGDERGWRRRGKGLQEPQPALAQWRRDRLRHPVLLLTLEQRSVVERECRRHGDCRCWRCWAINARSNHCHVVVTAAGYAGSTARDQLKANATRGLRENWPVFRVRPVWTRGGDWQCVNDESDLEKVCVYVRDAQDRMDRES